MVPLLYIFPIIFLLLVIAGFFVNLAEPKGKIIFISVAVVSLILLVGNEVTLHMQLGDLGKIETKLEQQSDWKTGQIARMNTILASMSAESMSEKQKMSAYASLGWSSKNPVFIESLMADEARIQLLKYTPPARHKAVIENLPDSIDKMLVSFALEEMGFVVRAQQHQEEYEDKPEDNDIKNEGVGSKEDGEPSKDEEGKETKKDKKSKKKKDKKKKDKKKVNKKKKPTRSSKEVNTLHFGHLVRNNDLKLVLYTMLRAGIQIRSVRVFREQTKDNARHIKFDYSKTYEKKAPLTVKKIKKTKLFKR